MKIKDCCQCRYNHWGLGIGVGVACVHPDNQKYNPKQRKDGEEENYHNSTTQISRIPTGCELRKEGDRSQSIQITEKHLLGFHLFNVFHRHPTGGVIGATEYHFPTNTLSFQMPACVSPKEKRNNVPCPFLLSSLYIPMN